MNWANELRNDVLAALLYNVRGMRVPSITSEVFAPIFAQVLDAMVPDYQIIKSAGIDVSGEWESNLEQAIIDAHTAHLLEKWQPAHNVLMVVKPERTYQRVHRRAMTASRAYGETVTTYIEHQRMFLSPQYLTKAYFRKQRDGRQWDVLAREHTRGLIDELERVAIQHPQAFKLLLPSGEIPDGVESIGGGKPEFLPQYAVCPFGISY
ncbi:MAG: hypothetical protein AAB303_05490 [Chloroflexota bacterium]